MDASTEIYNVSLVLICLNDSHNLEAFFNSIKNQKFSGEIDLVVVDGGSSDDSIAIAKKFTKKVLQTQPGMKTQTILGLSQCKYPIVILGEADHIYPPNFIEEFYRDFLKSNYDGMSASITFSRSSNFLERGHANFYNLHFKKLGVRELIAGTQIWHLNNIIDILRFTKGGENFSFDTERAESARSLGVVQGLSGVSVLEGYGINFKKFLDRHRNYGYGDYQFYKTHYTAWRFSRKLKSLSHVFIRYGVKLPILLIINRMSFTTVFYFWLIMLTRYFFWLQKYGIEIKKKYDTPKGFWQ